MENLPGAFHGATFMSITKPAQAIAMNQNERDNMTRELELILQEKNTQNKALEKLIRELKKAPPKDHPRKYFHP